MRESHLQVHDGRFQLRSLASPIYDPVSLDGPQALDPPREFPAAPVAVSEDRRVELPSRMLRFPFFFLRQLLQ